MKAFIPYAVLGLIGAAGAVAGVKHVSNGSPTPIDPVATPTPSEQNGSVHIDASLDRTALPTDGGDAFVRVALTGIVPAQSEPTKRLPVALTIVIDRSGSMGQGTKMEDAKRAAAEAIASLQAGNRVCVISFDAGAANHGCGDVSEVREQLGSQIAKLFARGGTDMVSGLQVGGNAATTIFSADRVNRLLLLSDGRPDTEAGLKEQVAALAQRGVSTTTLGLGEDYNEELMASLADAGLGHYYFVEKPEQLVDIFGKELKSISTVVARNAMIDLVPQNGTTITDVIGFRFDRSGSNAVVIPAGDIYGGRTTDVLVRVHTAKNDGKNDVVKATVTYTDAIANKYVSTDRVLTALFTSDANVVMKSVVADVAVKAEKWQAAQALLDANAAYDRGEKDAGDKILATSAAQLRSQAAAFNNDDLKLEAEEQVKYKAANEANGAEWRGVGTKMAKKRAWSMNKGSAY